jgi:Fe-S cluster assembly scaffold protein SufB
MQPMAKSDPQIVTDYKYGFSKPEEHVFKSEKGLNEEKIRQISKLKNEPEWMLEMRLRAYQTFLNKPMPPWGADLSEIDFDEIFYYIKPTEGQKQTWEELPDNIKDTYDKLGIPEAERKFLAGVSAQYESEVVYHSLIQELTDQGVIFTDMDTALREYPDLVKQYFGTLIPAADNKFAALNTSVWSGGSFVYIPKGVKVKIPLQAYFRINAKNMGQFERTLIIAEEGSFVHYIEGCFLAGAKVRTNLGEKNIEDIKVGDKVLTHRGRFQKVYNKMQRPYQGTIYNISYYGDSKAKLRVTEEHPLLVSRRQKSEYRNTEFKLEWLPASDVKKDDYLVCPINDISVNKDIHKNSQVATDKNYIYLPIKSISTEEIEDLVYNFSVEEDESYVAEGVVSHNCTAPVYSTHSLHSAVVEIFCKPGSRVRYTTVQNWSPNVYNLVTKRAIADENAIMEWIDGNLGSYKTMKYPSIYLRGKGARGIVVSAAYAGQDQEQDTGTKIFHMAPNTSSEVIAKSVSKDNGKTTYRGMISVAKGAKNSKISVKCDALLLDKESKTDTIPVNIVTEEDVEIEHEASVSRLKDVQLNYLCSRGITSEDASSMAVNGFMDTFTRELPMEYAVELNRLIAMNMEGSVG